MQIQVNKLNNSLIILDKESIRARFSKLSSVLLCLASLVGMSDVLFGKEPLDALFLLNAFLFMTGLTLVIIINYKKSYKAEIPIQDIEAFILKDISGPIYVLKLKNGRRRNLPFARDTSNIQKIKTLLQQTGIPILKEE